MAKKRLTSLRILVVEDEPLLRRRFTSFLEGLGAEVTAAPNLHEAEKALTTLDFDVALLDVNLPDGLGTDLCKRQCISTATVTLVMTAGGGVAGAVVGAARVGTAHSRASGMSPKARLVGDTGAPGGGSLIRADTDSP